MDIAFTLTKSDLYDRVDVLTAYTGAKGEDVAQFDKVATATADRELLGIYLDESLGLLSNAIAGFNPTITNGEDAIVIAFTLPSVADSGLVAMAESEMGDYLVKVMTGKWFSIASKPDAEALAVEAASLIEDIIKKLNYKSAPQRPSYENN